MVPSDFMRSLGWIDDGVVIGYLPNDIRVFDFSVSGSKGTITRQESLPLHTLSTSPTCPAIAAIELFQRLGDGRLGYLVFCRQQLQSNDVSTSASKYLMAYDPRTKHVAPLRQTPLPESYLGFDHTYTWNPPGTRGILSGIVTTRTAYYATAWFTVHDLEYLRYNQPLPVVRQLAWSPDGGTIALLGESSATQRGLYLMEPDGTNVRLLSGGLEMTAGLAWSPDSRWLVVSGSIPGATQARSALSLVKVATGERWLLTDTFVREVAWSPDGRWIACVVPLRPMTQSERRIVGLIEIQYLLEKL
jgi:hypothetical protein